MPTSPNTPVPPLARQDIPQLATLETLRTRHPGLPIVRADLVQLPNGRGATTLMVRVPDRAAVHLWATAVNEGPPRRTGMSRYGDHCTAPTRGLDSWTWWSVVHLDFLLDQEHVRIWCAEVNDDHIAYLELAAMTPSTGAGRTAPLGPGCQADR